LSKRTARGLLTLGLPHQINKYGGQRLALDLAALGMHFRVMRFEFIPLLEVFLAVLTRITGMDLTVVLFPFHPVIEGCAAFLTSMVMIRRLSHLMFSF
jgi:hypothetical protein